MELTELIEALANGDTLAARQWVADAVREGFDWSRVSRPQALSESTMAIAAGITELLAARAGQAAPERSDRSFCNASSNSLFKELP